MPKPITNGHGTRACYARGCRRPACVNANRLYVAESRERAKKKRKAKR